MASRARLRSPLERVPIGAASSGSSARAAHDLVAKVRPSREEADGEVERPAQGLGGPGRDAVGHVEEKRPALLRADHVVVLEQDARGRGHHAGQALEQRGLARAVGADDAEHLAGVDRETDVDERRPSGIGLGQAGDT
jgi:hypothetical protein